METQITIKKNLDSLDKLLEILKNQSTYKCSKEYDSWEIRTDTNGQMEQCLVIKKSNMHAVKLYFLTENTMKISYIIPNKTLNAYFGKSAEARRNIIEMLTGLIKQAILAGPQKKAFKELEQKIITILGTPSAH